MSSIFHYYMKNKKLKMVIFLGGDVPTDNKTYKKYIKDREKAKVFIQNENYTEAYHLPHYNNVGTNTVIPDWESPLIFDFWDAALQ